MIDGRWLNNADIELHTRSVVLGAGLAKQYAYLPRRDPHDQAQQHELRRRRRARDASRSIPISTTRCSSRSGPRSTTSRPTGSRTSSTCARRPATRRRPPTRSRPRSTSAGPTRCRPRCRATCCRPRRRPTRRLQQTALFAGLLALRGRRPRHRERHVDLGDPTVVGDRHPARGRPQPLEDRLAVPARVAVRRHPRRAPRRRARRSGSCISSPRSRTGSSSSPTAGSRSGWASRSSCRSPPACTRRSRPRASNRSRRCASADGSARRAQPHAAVATPARVPSAGCRAGNRRAGAARIVGAVALAADALIVAPLATWSTGSARGDDAADDHVRPAARPHAEPGRAHRHRDGVVRARRSRSRPTTAVDLLGDGNERRDDLAAHRSASCTVQADQAGNATFAAAPSGAAELQRRRRARRRSRSVRSPTATLEHRCRSSSAPPRRRASGHVHDDRRPRSARRAGRNGSTITPVADGNVHRAGRPAGQHASSTRRRR